jgi:hypothetical protein
MRELRPVGGAGDARADRGGLLGAVDLALDGLGEGLLDDREAARDLRVVEIDEDDEESLGRGLLGDAASHVAGADDGESS